MAQATVAAGRTAERPATSGLARFGLAARAVVYLVIGWLAIEIAAGDPSHQANQRGALAAIAQQTGGLALLWVLGFGLGAYALWRLIVAVRGTPTDGKKAGPRLKSAVRGAIYAGICGSTFSFIAGSRQSQKKQQSTLTAQVMRHDFGRWLVGAVGIVVVVIGVSLVVEGATKKFTRDLQLGQTSPTTRKVVVRTGMVGTIARGIVFGVAGGLVVAAAVTFDPKKSSGLDGALRTLAHQTYGPYLLGALAAGLIAFGLFGLAAARWAKT